jgi:hypothetical protein
VLDDGVSNRVAKMLIKGFGNSIVPLVASEFICAFDECANDALTRAGETGAQMQH